jgi:retron-type reverse transcriptase
MDQADYEAFKKLIDQLSIQIKQLKRANINMKRENKYLKRVVKKYKDERAKDRKSHYKNGKRGIKYNG